MSCRSALLGGPSICVAKAPDDYILDTLLLEREAFVYPGLLTPEDRLKLDSWETAMLGVYTNIRNATII